VSHFKSHSNTQIHFCNSNNQNALEHRYGFVMFPVMIHGFDIVVSSLGVLAAYNAPNWIYRLRKPLLVLKVGFLATLVCSVVFFYITCQWLLYVPGAPQAANRFFCCGLLGIGSATLMVRGVFELIVSHENVNWYHLYHTRKWFECTLLFLQQRSNTGTHHSVLHGLHTSSRTKHCKGCSLGSCHSGNFGYQCGYRKYVVFDLRLVSSLQQHTLHRRKYHSLSLRVYSLSI